MYHIVLIGSGELGSRHLQGLLKLNLLVTIYVVDNNTDSLNKAKTRANEVTPNEKVVKVSYLSQIEELPCEIDICIVATTSNVRFEIIQKLINIVKVKNLILEKVLFQKLSDYKKARIFLASKKIKTWVNCPRRLFDVYKEIKKSTKINEKLTLTVNGGSWGLACNSIHFIDILSFLNSNYEFNFTLSSKLKVIDSKRVGYFELMGSLHGRQTNGSEIHLNSFKENNLPLKIEISSENYLWEINETNGDLITTSVHDTNKRSITNFDMPFQSDLTNLICEEILGSGKSSLTDFEESIKLHEKLLEYFQIWFKKDLDINMDICPIT